MDKILSGLDNITKDYLGPNYNYASQIKSPSQLGMSSEGSLGALENDVAGLIEYIEVLVDGKSNAQVDPKSPLGNQYFLKTIAQCNDTSTNT